MSRVITPSKTLAMARFRHWLALIRFGEEDTDERQVWCLWP